nr:TlpA disulfide reductase family protein [Hyunsoonleella ulvae]
MGENTTSSTTIENVDVNFKFKENQWTQKIYPDGYLITTSNEYYKKLRNTVLKNIGKQIKSFELPVLNKENTINISKLKGNVILLEFWFKGCGPCLASIPSLNKIEEKYRGKKFKLYGIETKEKNTSDELISYIKKQNIQYENLSNGKKFSEAYNVVSAPTFFLIDKNGTIVSIKTGYSKQNMKKLELLIEQLL